MLWTRLAPEPLLPAAGMKDEVYGVRLRGPSQTFHKHEPLREIFSLDDYRIRHGQYKTDVHLQAAHAAHPWLVTWDDHEFKNNYADLDLTVLRESAPCRSLATFAVENGRAGAHRVGVQPVTTPPGRGVWAATAARPAPNRGGSTRDVRWASLRDRGEHDRDASHDRRRLR